MNLRITFSEAEGRGNAMHLRFKKYTIIYIQPNKYNRYAVSVMSQAATDLELDWS